MSAPGSPFGRLVRNLTGHWQAAALLTPLLLLAGIGVRGLQASRQAALDGARLQAARNLDQMVPTLRTLWDNARAAAPRVRLYPLLPVPTSTGAANDLYAQALEQSATMPAQSSAILIRLEAQYPDALTAGGVPLLPLVEWSRLRLETDRAELPERASALCNAALEAQPSILTPTLLTRGEACWRERGVELPALQSWRQEWNEDEQARTVWREHEEEVAGAASSVWLTDRNGPTWWVQRVAGDEPARRFRSREAVRSSFRSIGAQVASSLPDYAALTFTLDSVALGPAGGDTLAARALGGLVIRVVLAAPERLYAQQRQQTLWLAGLLVCALAASLAGLWALRNALIRERQLGQLKSDFVSSVSHELRAPVAAMRLMAENLESDAVPTAARRREYHHHLAEECRRLSALIDNVLDFARIEQNRKTYDFAETDALALVRDALTLMQPSATQRRQEIAATLQPVDPPPVCDGLAVRQALVNLLDNAIKFSPEGTRVTVQLGVRSAAAWEIAVRDEGRGIPPAEHGRIFERFYRLGSELRRETQGAGIGLNIVRHIVDAHGGRVELESRPGAGSTFKLVFPRRPPVTVAANPH